MVYKEVIGCVRICQLLDISPKNRINKPNFKPSILLHMKFGRAKGRNDVHKYATMYTGKTF